MIRDDIYIMTITVFLYLTLFYLFTSNNIRIIRCDIFDFNSKSTVYCNFCCLYVIFNHFIDFKTLTENNPIHYPVKKTNK